MEGSPDVGDEVGPLQRQRFQDILLLDDRLDALFGDYFKFVHNFEGQNLSCVFVDNFPNLAKGALSDGLDPLKPGFAV